MLTGSSVDQVMLCFAVELTQSVSSYKEGPELFKIQSCNIPGGKVKLVELNAQCVCSLMHVCLCAAACGQTKE